MNTHRTLVLIPSYNTGRELLQQTVASVLTACDLPVMVVIDGSTDGSAEALEKDSSGHSRLQILHLPENRGKGSAVFAGATAALAADYTHALVFDSDGQHPADEIDPMVSLIPDNETTMILGEPIFGSDAPLARVLGRKLTLFWTDVMTLWGGIGDSLFGMRIYPLGPLCKIFAQTRFARGFDFDPEVAVRLYWAGVKPVRHRVPCRYLGEEEKGVSHFHYLRDNAKLTLLPFRLTPPFLLCHLWTLLGHKSTGKHSKSLKQP